MVEIELRFPTGRVHASPWDHHVNEGIVEWPPAPWRLLRALVATWHLKSTEAERRQGDEHAERLRSLVWALAAEPPEYVLPAGVPFHTRHFVPLYKDTTTKIFDAFLHVGDQPLVVRWPQIDLAAPDRRLLEVLVRRLGYLGRAESWVEGALREHTGGEVADVVPLEAGGAAGAEEGELVRVLAPMRPAEYASWQAAEITRREAARLAEKQARAASRGKPPEREKLTAKDRQSLASALPASLFEALQVDTGELRRAGWSEPPGSRWIDYRRPAGKVDARPAARKPRRAPAAERTVARFALASAVLPRLTEAVSFSDRMRKGLISRGGEVPVFTGRDAGGNLCRGHGHAFILPEANRQQGRITHVTICAAMGFEDGALRALHRLSKVWGHGGHDVQTVLIGVGGPESFAGTDLDAGECPLLVESSVWVSRTPFVPTRHPKVTRRGLPKEDADGLQIGSPEHDLRRLLRELGARYPEPTRVERTGGTYLGGKAVRWSAFRTQRDDGGGKRAGGVGYGFRIEFPEPVRGPIAVGYGAHFGLGTFVPPLERLRPIAFRR